jgi:hypothetical protein
MRWILRRLLGESHPRQLALRPRADLGGRLAPHRAQSFQDIADRCHVREEVELLEQHADALAHRCQLRLAADAVSLRALAAADPARFMGIAVAGTKDILTRASELASVARLGLTRAGGDLRGAETKMELDGATALRTAHVQESS